MTFAQLIMEDALINERSNQRRLYSAAVAIGDHSQAKIHKKRIKEIQKQLCDYRIKEEKIMTREDKLWSMRGRELIKEANKLGVKVVCNKTKTQLTESKANVVKRILAFEAEQSKEVTSEPTADAHISQSKAISEEHKQNDKPIQKKSKYERKTINKEETEHLFKKKEIKKPNLKIKELTYKNETKSIRAWADQIGMPWATLYDRINRNGWSTEEAIETPLGQRRRKK